MGDQLNQVEAVSIEAFAAVVRDRGIFVRPIDGVLVGRNAPGAVEVQNPDDDTSICVSFPKGALCVNMRSPGAAGFSFAGRGMSVASNVGMCLGRHSIVRLPCGSLLDVQYGRVAFIRVGDGTKDLDVRLGERQYVPEIYSLDVVRRLLERLVSHPDDAVDLGGRIITVFEAPDLDDFDVPSYLHVISVAVGDDFHDFHAYEMFILPEGMRGLTEGKVTVALWKGEPIVISEIAPVHARWIYREMFHSLRLPMRDGERKDWDETVAPSFDGVQKLLTRVMPISRVWNATRARDAWIRMDASAAREFGSAAS